MQYIECPNLEPFVYKSVFLAGGITGCENWQSKVVELMRREQLTILNPRRKNFPVDDPKAAPQQIYWEYLMMKQADTILFWFPKETLCPITLYELGTWTRTNKPIFIGVDPDYKRKIDVEIQTRLVKGNDFEIFDSMERLVREFIRIVYD